MIGRLHWIPLLHDAVLHSASPSFLVHQNHCSLQLICDIGVDSSLMVFVPGIKHKESCSISCTHHADRLLLKLWYRSFPCLLQDKLAYFRIKELKDILNQLGLPKQGKKQVSECFPFLFPVFFPTLRFTSLYMYDFYWWIHGIQSSGVACCLVINRCGACMLCTTHFGCNYGFAERTWIQYCYFRTSYLPYLPQFCFLWYLIVFSIVDYRT